MSLVLTNKLFKSPLELFFECCGIAMTVPIIINETEVIIDFHIFTILEFDLVIGYPLDKLFQEKYPHRSLSEKFGKIVSATHLEIRMAEHLPNHDPFEEVKFISPFVSPRLSSKTNIHHQPRSNQNHVPLAKTSMPWTFLKHQLGRLRRRIPPLSMKVSLSRPLTFYAHF